MAKKKSVPVPQLVVKSKAKEFLADNGFRCSADALDQLNNDVAAFLVRAGQRCQENNRSTVKPQDL